MFDFNYFGGFSPTTNFDTPFLNPMTSFNSGFSTDWFSLALQQQSLYAKMDNGCGMFCVSGKAMKSKYTPLIQKIAMEEGVNPELAIRIAQQESGFNPYARSKAGAMGMFQLMPGTAKEMGVKDPFNPEQNIRGGIKYFKKMMRACNGDERLALAAYNSGLGSVRKAGGIPRFTETMNYVKKIWGDWRAPKIKCAV